MSTEEDQAREKFMKAPLVKLMSQLFAARVMKLFSAKIKEDETLTSKLVEHFVASVQETMPPELLEGTDVPELRKAVRQGIVSSLDDFLVQVGIAGVSSKS
jgi:hypothetical protein